MKCSATTKAGERCTKYAIAGGTVCGTHGGSAPAVKAKAAVRAEVAKWTLGEPTVDPGEVLLRLLTQATVRADTYARLIEDKFQEANDDPDVTLESVLIGEVWVSDESGGSHKAGEYIRGLIDLERKERILAADFATKAVAAGLAERQVRLAERQGALLAQVMVSVMADPTLGFSEQQRSAIPLAIERHLSSLTEGSTS